MDSSIQNYKDLMDDFQNAKARSAEEMVSQEAGEQTGWATTENWLTEEREKQKNRMIERNATSDVEVPKTSLKRRAEVAEEKVSTLELDLKSLEKKLQTTFETLEVQGKQCVEYAAKYKEAQLQANRYQLAVQKLEEQLEKMRIEIQDLKNTVSHETETTTMTSAVLSSILLLLLSFRHMSDKSPTRLAF